MGTGVVLCPIIPYISLSWPPKVAELLLAIPASEPVEFHVNWFGGLGENFIIDKAVCCFVVCLYGCLWFRMA